MLARVRVDHQRQRRQALQLLQRRRGVFQRDTVDAQRDDLRIVLQRRNHLPQRRAVAQVLAVAQGEGEPRPRAGIRRQQRGQRLYFRERRQRFAGQQVCTSVQQRFHARAMEFCEFFGTAHVVAAIL